MTHPLTREHRLQHPSLASGKTLIKDPLHRFCEKTELHHHLALFFTIPCETAMHAICGQWSKGTGLHTSSFFHCYPNERLNFSVLFYKMTDWRRCIIYGFYIIFLGNLLCWSRSQQSVYILNQTNSHGAILLLFCWCLFLFLCGAHILC